MPSVQKFKGCYFTSDGFQGVQYPFCCQGDMASWSLPKSNEAFYLGCTLLEYNLVWLFYSLSDLDLFVAGELVILSSCPFASQL